MAQLHAVTARHFEGSFASVALFQAPGSEQRIGRSLKPKPLDARLPLAPPLSGVVAFLVF